MDRTTYPRTPEHVKTPLTGPSGPTQTGADAAGASILRRPLRLTLQVVSTLVMDSDGELRQERLLLPLGTLDDILWSLYYQMDMELLALDRLPGETVDAEVDIGTWVDSILTLPHNTNTN